MLNRVKLLLTTKEAHEVMLTLTNSGLSPLEAAQLIVKALEAPQKIKAKKFIILWSEGMVEENVEFSSWAAFNSQLDKIAVRNGDMGYVKTRFQVLWADGHEYNGRLDVSLKEDTNLGQHIMDYLKFSTGEHKPVHMSELEYKESYLEPEKMKECKEMLAKYEIVI